MTEFDNGFEQKLNKNNNIFPMSLIKIQVKQIMKFDSQNTTQQNKKTFVFQNQVTSQSSIVYHRVNTDGPFTDIKPILDQHCPIEKNKIQLFNTFQNRFTPLQKLNPDNPCMVPSQFLQFGFIMIRFKTHRTKEEMQQFSEEQIEESSELSNNKKDRAKERTIGQVIELVKRWRRIHSGNQGKKLNLQQAAKIVGVSKKSLDDYYYQLRIGQQFDYDFQQHLNEKIGDLRSFVKSRKPQKMQKHRNSKHPKRLKIIEEGTGYDEPESQEEQMMNQNNYPSPQSPLLGSSQNPNDPFFQQSSSLGLDRNLERIENNYYQNFQNFLDDDHDPFFYVGDFRKKDSFNFGSDSDILF